jgi:hypothetical protein
MTGNSSANDGGLIVDPVILANIQRLCRGAAQRPIEVLGSPQSDFGVARVPPPIPPLPGSFWQAVLYGSPDSLLSAADSTRALQLIADKLGAPTVEGEMLGALRAAQLRKLLRERFGPLEAEGAIAALWRRAPASPGVPQSAEDQSQLPPGPFPPRPCSTGLDP